MEQHPLSTPALNERLAEDADSLAMMIEAAQCNWEWLSDEAVAQFVVIRSCLRKASSQLYSLYDEIGQGLPDEQLDLLNATRERATERIDQTIGNLFDMARGSMPPGFYHDDPRAEDDGEG